MLSALPRSVELRPMMPPKTRFAYRAILRLPFPVHPAQLLAFFYQDRPDALQYPTLDAHGTTVPPHFHRLAPTRINMAPIALGEPLTHASIRLSAPSFRTSVVARQYKMRPWFTVIRDRTSRGKNDVSILFLVYLATSFISIFHSATIRETTATMALITATIIPATDKRKLR